MSLDPHSLNTEVLREKLREPRHWGARIYGYITTSGHLLVIEDKDSTTLMRVADRNGVSDPGGVFQGDQFILVQTYTQEKHKANLLLKGRSVWTSSPVLAKLYLDGKGDFCLEVFD